MCANPATTVFCALMVNFPSLQRESLIYLRQCITNHFLHTVNTFKQKRHSQDRPDSSVVRASASGVVCRRFAPRRRYLKGDKNCAGSFPADARNKGVVPVRYKKAGKYLLRICVTDVVVKALQSLCCLFQTRFFIMFKNATS